MTHGLEWLDAHEGLAGWAQFVGSLIALALTAWIARRDSRARQRERTETMKAFLAVVAYSYSVARSACQELEAEHGKPDFVHSVKHYLDQIDQRRAALASFDVTHMTSTFMINNLGGVKGQLDILHGILSKLSGKSYPFYKKVIAMSVRDLRAICVNVGREVHRLGGRVETHDDARIWLWLEPSPWRRSWLRWNQWLSRRRRRRQGVIED